MRLDFLPALMVDAVTDISAELLQQQKIELLMLDFDNTIVPYTTDIPTAEVENWLRQMQQSDVRLCVVSNSRNDRVKRFCDRYGLSCITHAQKPFLKGIVACLRRFDKAPEKCALVGDQIFTDTLGANGAGVRAILVKAIHNHNIWLKLRHVAEMPFIFAASKRRVTK